MKRTISTFLSVLLILFAAVISLSAEKIANPVYWQYNIITIKEYDYLPIEKISAIQSDRMARVGGEWVHIEVEHPDYCLYGIPPVKENHLSYAEVKALQTQLLECSALACKHEKTAAYHDTDLDKYGETCLRCGLELENSENAKLAIKRIDTSAEKRAACSHEYRSWSSFGNFTHVRYCSLCHVRQAETHSLVPANCAEAEHCEICGEQAYWEKAWGHVLGYSYTGDYLSNHKHDYHCKRMNHDTERICDYVEFSEDCHFTTYWESESGGMHEIYEMCDECCIGGEVLYESCSMASAHECWYCMNPNAWDLP